MGVPAHGAVGLEGPRRHAFNESKVVTPHAPIRKLCRQRALRAFRPGDHQEPRGIFVEAMHQPGPGDLAQLWIVIEQRVAEGSVPVPSARVNH